MLRIRKFSIQSGLELMTTRMIDEEVLIATEPVEEVWNSPNEGKIFDSPTKYLLFL